jgi:hypothetical protein
MCSPAQWRRSLWEPHAGGLNPNQYRVGGLENTGAAFTD